jgi:hypothetical protein
MVKLPIQRYTRICKLLPFSVGETSDGGQCWPKHGKACFHVKLATLDGLAVHLSKGRPIILRIFMFYIYNETCYC